MAKKALIAMSGGVDSSVAAWLMKKQGWDCIGVTMRLFDNDDAYLDRETILPLPAKLKEPTTGISAVRQTRTVILQN